MGASLGAVWFAGVNCVLAANASSGAMRSCGQSFYFCSLLFVKPSVVASHLSRISCVGIRTFFCSRYSKIVEDQVSLLVLKQNNYLKLQLMRGFLKECLVLF